MLLQQERFASVRWVASAIFLLGEAQHKDQCPFCHGHLSRLEPASFSSHRVTATTRQAVSNQSLKCFSGNKNSVYKVRQLSVVYNVSCWLKWSFAISFSWRKNRLCFSLFGLIFQVCPLPWIVNFNSHWTSRRSRLIKASRHPTTREPERRNSLFLDFWWTEMKTGRSWCVRYEN